LERKAFFSYGQNHGTTFFAIRNIFSAEMIKKIFRSLKIYFNKPCKTLLGEKLILTGQEAKSKKRKNQQERKTEKARQCAKNEKNPCQDPGISV